MFAQTRILWIFNKLAWRDFHEKFTLEEIEKMSKKHGGYLGIELHPFEEKYWREFEENDYTRLRIEKTD